MVNVIALISFPPPLLQPLNLLSSHLMDHSTSLRLLLPVEGFGNVFTSQLY